LRNIGRKGRFNEKVHAAKVQQEECICNAIMIELINNISE
jgi:hypothetical protein